MLFNSLNLSHVQSFKACFVLGCVWLIFCLGGFGWCTLWGVGQLQNKIAHSADNTREQCLLVDYDETECVYSCSETSDIQCAGITYQYFATIESKCDNQTLVGFDDDCSSTNATMKTLETEHTCYAYDCDSEFTFSHPGDHYAGPWLAIVCGVIGVIGMPCIFLYHHIKDWWFERQQKKRWAETDGY